MPSSKEGLRAEMPALYHALHVLKETRRKQLPGSEIRWGFPKIRGTLILGAS